MSSSTKKCKIAFIDLSRSKNKYEQISPDLYYSNNKKGWYCKICSSFAQSISGPKSFVNKVDDHPNRTISSHLSSLRQQNAVKNKLPFKELILHRTSVFQLLHEASFASEIWKQKTNRFVIKSFFWITWFLTSKNWAHSHNFQTLAELVSEFDEKELQTHLVTFQRMHRICRQIISKNISKLWTTT